MDVLADGRARTSLLDAFLDELADRLVEKLAQRERRAAPRHADAKNNPLGSARAFLDAGRRGAFPTFKRGREVVALWVDVESYIENRRRAPRSQGQKENGSDEDRALLERAGVLLRGRAERDEPRHLAPARRSPERAATSSPNKARVGQSRRLQGDRETQVTTANGSGTLEVDRTENR